MHSTCSGSRTALSKERVPQGQVYVQQSEPRATSTVLLLTRHVPHPPRLQEMFRGPRDGQDDKQDGGRHIRPAQEGVLASHPRDGREDDRLGSRELSDRVVYRPQQHEERVSHARTCAWPTNALYSLMLIVISYVPLFITSSSFLPHNLLNVGKAEVLIQTWKCSSSAKGGNDS